MKKQEIKISKNKKENEEKIAGCLDRFCPTHGSLRTRGRMFSGYVIRKFDKRIVIEFERTVFIRKFERYMNKKTKIHARLPQCMKDEIKLGDYVRIIECRPLSKLIHFVVDKLIKSKEERR